MVVKEDEERFVTGRARGWGEEIEKERISGDTSKVMTRGV